MKRMITDKDRVALNQSLKDLQELQDHIRKAKEAGLPTADTMLERCNDCEDRINKIKKAYFPNKG